MAWRALDLARRRCHRGGRSIGISAVAHAVSAAVVALHATAVLLPCGRYESEPSEVGRPTADPSHSDFEVIVERPAVVGDAVRLLTDGDAFGSLFAAIEPAQSHVLIEIHILRDHRLGRALQERLVARAAAGVSVRVLYDPFGSHGLDRAHLDAMRAAGIEIVDFHARRGPLRLAAMRLDFRNHRKIAVVDGRIDFTGGFNLGDKDRDRDPKFGACATRWSRLEGPVVDPLPGGLSRESALDDGRASTPAGAAPRLRVGRRSRDGVFYFLLAIGERNHLAVSRRSIWAARGKTWWRGDDG